MKQVNKIKSLIFGDAPIYLANNGKPVDVEDPLNLATPKSKDK
jgi:hypothetical protein